MNLESVDVAVVGAGIVGLSHAWAAARRGLKVALFERTPIAQGASIRNFGMIWPIGQPPGALLERALLSRRLWLELSPKARLWAHPCGSLHLAHEADELAVLEEFAGRARDWGYNCEMLTPAQVLERSPAVRPEGLRGGLSSATECCVTPRQAIAQIPPFLAVEHGVQLYFNTTIRAVEPTKLFSADGRTWRAERILVCNGTDFETLFPEVFLTSSLRRCKLQMMATRPQPGGWRLGPHIAGGLTLCHYAAFRSCPSLDALRQRINETMPQYVRFGIHVMASQNHLGEVVIGDSHEYGDEIEVFDKTEIDDLILAYLRRLVRLPDETIQSRWHGTYAKHPTEALFEASPLPGVTILAAPGGAGMTLSFGQAEEWWRRQN